MQRNGGKKKFCRRASFRPVAGYFLAVPLFLQKICYGFCKRLRNKKIPVAAAQGKTRLEVPVEITASGAQSTCFLCQVLRFSAPEIIVLAVAGFQPIGKFFHKKSFGCGKCPLGIPGDLVHMGDDHGAACPVDEPGAFRR